MAEDDMAAGSGGSIDALSQFKLEPVLGPLGTSLYFSQANLMMVVACVLVKRPWCQAAYTTL